MHEALIFFFFWGGGGGGHRDTCTYLKNIFIALFVAIWDKILLRLHSMKKYSQDPKMNLPKAIKSLNYLKKYISKLRNDFKVDKEEAIILSETTLCKTEKKFL